MDQMPVQPACAIDRIQSDTDIWLEKELNMSKTRKAAIIGIGHVGAHVASALATQGFVDDILLLDQDEDKVISEVQDLNDAMLWMPHTVRIHGGDFEDLKDVDVIINCVGNISTLQVKNDRTLELRFNLEAVDSYASQIVQSGFDGVIINISNPCDVITRHLAMKTGLPKGRVFGTGTGLDSSRLISAISKKTGLNLKSIDACMMGEHGNLQFAPASVFSFRGAPLESVVPDLELDWKQLEKEAIDGGWVTFSRKHCTEYGIAATAARMTQAVLEDEQIVLPASAPLEGEYGVRGLFAGVPCVIGANGAEQVIELPLTEDELDRMQMCCTGIAKNIEKAAEIEAGLA